MIRKSIALVIALLAAAIAAHADAPVYSGAAAIEIIGGVPEFAETAADPFIEYDPLDKWERASKATACLGPETLALAGRTPMRNIEPSGWQNDTYDFISGFNLYQRCHLIGDQLGGDYHCKFYRVSYNK